MGFMLWGFEACSDAFFGALGYSKLGSPPACAMFGTSPLPSLSKDAKN